LAATLAYLAGSHHVSKRGLEEVAEAIFAVPLAPGTISHLEGQMSAALAVPHAEVLEAVRAAPVKNVDETGWKQAGQKRLAVAGGDLEGGGIPDLRRPRLRGAEGVVGHRRDRLLDERPLGGLRPVDLVAPSALLGALSWSRSP
jgi:hypothetical protein